MESDHLSSSVTLSFRSNLRNKCDLSWRLTTGSRRDTGNSGQRQETLVQREDRKRKIKQEVIILRNWRHNLHTQRDCDHQSYLNYSSVFMIYQFFNILCRNTDRKCEKWSSGTVSRCWPGFKPDQLSFFLTLNRPEDPTENHFLHLFCFLSQTTEKVRQWCRIWIHSI